MKHTRAILVSALFGSILSAPFFVFAQATNPSQTTATSTADQTALAEEELQKNIDKYKTDLEKLIEERTNAILTPEEIEKKTTSDSLDVRISPQNPGPQTDVTITIESYLSDLQKATIKWSLDNKTILQGAGRTAFTFQTGASGKTTRVSATITLNTGIVIVKNFSFTPVGVTILWEANTYTPPFYKGKALITPEARVRVAVIPDNANSGTTAGAGNYTYTWEQDGTVDKNASGYGKNIYSLSGPRPLSSKDVRVTVASMDEKSKSNMRIVLPLSRPFILFYEKHPLLGVWYNRPFDRELTLTKKEFSISAEPYFFSDEDTETPTLKYAWSVNGKRTTNSGRNITLRNEAGITGVSNIALAMRGINKTFQSADQKITVRFTEGESTERPTF